MKRMVITEAQQRDARRRAERHARLEARNTATRRHQDARKQADKNACRKPPRVLDEDAGGLYIGLREVRHG